MACLPCFLSRPFTNGRDTYSSNIEQAEVFFLTSTHPIQLSMSTIKHYITKSCTAVPRSANNDQTITGAGCRPVTVAGFRGRNPICKQARNQIWLLGEVDGLHTSHTRSLNCLKRPETRRPWRDCSPQSRTQRPPLWARQRPAGPWQSLAGCPPWYLTPRLRVPFGAGPGARLQLQ